jgi:hypothetical protein
MVKSLLLGSAAGLVAVAGAQAADLPVKAKPVEYVRVCSLYGAGFFYAPGTETCVKFGMAIRVQVEYNAGAGGEAVGSAPVEQLQGRLTRADTNDINFRNRIYFSMDARTQTEYGTLRSYFRMGISQTTPSDPATGNVFWDRAFIQFAGFTVGHTQSFFDIYTYGGAQTYLNVRTSGDSGPSGLTVFAYTAQFGNGFTATLSLEDPGAGHNRAPVTDLSGPGFWGLGTQAGADNAFQGQNANQAGVGGAVAGGAGFQMPDIIGSLRIDQSWGYAGVSGAIHQVGGAYYLSPDSTLNGHPSDAIGWAVGIGGMFYAPWFAPGDKFGFNAVYSQGAAGYAQNIGNTWLLYKGGTSVGVGWVTDAVFDCTNNVGGVVIAGGGCTGSLQLTTAWDALAAFEHHWTPQLWTVLYGGYAAVTYNSTAQALINTHLAGAAGSLVCGVPVGGAVATPVGGNPLVGNSCSPNSSWYQIGTVTHWNPHPDLDIGLEVLYTHLNSAFQGPVAAIAASGAQPGCVTTAITGCTVDNQNVWTVMARWQRNFLP